MSTQIPLPSVPCGRITEDMAHYEDDLLRTRATLLARIKDLKDNASWQQFFDKYGGLIYGVARQTGLNHTEAQDVVQETMSAVARHMPSFQYDPAVGSFKAYLLTITRRRVIDQLRKRKHSPGPVQGAATATGTVTASIEQLIDPASLSLDAVWEVEWQRNLLQAALTEVKRKIDPEKFQIFDFYVNKEWPAEKVADRFDTSSAQVHLIKCRVTKLLKEEVKRLEKQTT